MAISLDAKASAMVDGSVSKEAQGLFNRHRAHIETRSPVF